MIICVSSPPDAAPVSNRHMVRSHAMCTVIAYGFCGCRFSPGRRLNVTCILLFNCQGTGTFFFPLYIRAAENPLFYQPFEINLFFVQCDEKTECGSLVIFTSFMLWMQPQYNSNLIVCEYRPLAGAKVCNFIYMTAFFIPSIILPPRTPCFIHHQVKISYLHK